MLHTRRAYTLLTEIRDNFRVCCRRCCLGVDRGRRPGVPRRLRFPSVLSDHHLLDCAPGSNPPQACIVKQVDTSKLPPKARGEVSHRSKRHRLRPSLLPGCKPCDFPVPTLCRK